MRNTYAFSSARGGISMAKYSLRKRREMEEVRPKSSSQSEVEKNKSLQVAFDITHFGVFTSSEFSEASADWQNMYCLSCSERLSCI